MKAETFFPSPPRGVWTSREAERERGGKKNKTAKANYQQHLYVSSTLHDISNESA